ncbi:RICIN domain-containing protein [Natrinema salsiterrestre]|uniref:Probable pectate lyase C n=1 Tax=Natrinema salsiterrestre TaxID=2950540 RepID=A0A9Q4Q4K0_9EURY|nr:RICIN domain-containing protein [Natrinema salsiterrestre]MDF9747288.1 RICIN domain-containing protein [Natrinema salsiterrestre]
MNGESSTDSSDESTTGGTGAALTRRSDTRARGRKADSTPARTDTGSTVDARRGLTRRRALAALGTSFVAGVTSQSVAADSGSDADVRRDGDTWHARNGGETVYRGTDTLVAIQAAVDSLTRGRTTKETVVVHDSGTIGPHEWDGDVAAVDLPSYTVLDVRGTLTVEDTGEDLVVPIRAQSVESIEIPRLSIAGNPRYGVWIQSCTDVRLGDLELSLHETEDVGLGVRIDDADGGRSRNVTLESAVVEGSEHHAVETYGVDDLEVGTVETADTGGCGLLLNDTSNATVDRVDATNPDVGGGYAGFRVANGAGPEISVNEVVVRGGARGVFGVSGSRGVAIDRVDIEGTGSHGILVQDCQDFEINGGRVRNNDNEAVRIDSRDDDTHEPATNVTVRNLRVVDDRSEPRQRYGIYETGPGTGENAIIDNDLRNAGTVADLEVFASSTTVEGNVLTGEEPPDSEPELPPLEPVELDGRYRIESRHSGQVVSIEDGSAEDGARVVQRPASGDPDQYWRFEHLGDGVHRIENEHSGSALDVLEASDENGTDVIQWEWTGRDNQRFLVGKAEDGDGGLVIAAVHSDQVLDVFERSTDPGAPIVQWPWVGGANQRWTISAVDETPSNRISVGEYEARDIDDDGLYEDVTGDGETSHGDVNALFRHLESDGVQNNPEKFDFDGNGRVGFSDVLELLERI